jgi:hypothetical protein
MANNFKVAIATRNAELDAMARQLDGGFMDIYDGAQPATPETAITTQVKLADLPLSATSAPAASGGQLTLNAITSDTDADATGTAAWFRAYRSDHTTAVCDGTVGTASADAIINATSIVQHARVDCTSCVINL